MRSFFVRAIINAIAIAVTAYFVPGIHVNNDIVPLLIVGIIVTLVNAFVKPVLTFLTFPITILTLGLFILVINALMLNLTAWLSNGALVIDGFWASVLGAIVMAVANMILEGITGVNKEPQKAK